MKQGHRQYLNLTDAGRQALQRIDELEALLKEEQKIRAAYGDELAKLRVAKGEWSPEVWRHAISKAIARRIAVHGDPAGVADDAIAIVRGG